MSFSPFLPAPQKIFKFTFISYYSLILSFSIQRTNQELKEETFKDGHIHNPHRKDWTTRPHA